MAGVQPQDLIDYAKNFLGVPYVWGGTSMSGVDCSGFMYLIAQHFGINIPRGSRDQIKLGNQVGSIDQAQPGDLVGFDSEGDGTAEHIGMYVGNGQIIVADTTGTNVRYNTLANEDRIVGIVRLPGVVNLNGAAVTGTPNFASIVSPVNNNAISAVPASRPTFDWWAGIGLRSPGLAAADETYGLIDSFLKTDPELGDLYSQAVAGSWTQDQFISALHETSWWTTNSDSARQMLTMKSTDPASWQKLVDDKQVELQDLAVKMGVHLSANGLQNMASTAVMLNQNGVQLKDQLSNYLTSSQSGWYGGYAGQVELGIKAYAQDQGVALDDKYVQGAVQGIVAGKDSLQAHRAFIQTQAESAFPAYADMIKQGMTVGQIAKPYLATMAKLWERDPNAIDLFDSTLRGALQAKTADGAPAVKQLYDFETQLRQDPKWLKTNNSREALMKAGSTVLSDMGLLSPTLGAAPQTSPTALQYVDPSRQGTGLSGTTNFPTLQGKQSSATAAAATSATSLAPDLSGAPA